MKPNSFVCFIIVVIVIGCSPSRESQRLAEIDSLLQAGNNEQAYRETLELQDALWQSEEEKAHFGLLLTRTSYLMANTLPSDSLIDASIAYYEKHVDEEKLTDAYYYKASNCYDHDDYAQAIINYKKAEKTASKTGDLRQLYKIAESILFVNKHEGNSNLQLEYARRALGYASSLADKNLIAYSYYNLCLAFQDIEDDDSLSFYAERLTPLLYEASPQDLPEFLACIGFSYYKLGEMGKAKKYYDESLSHQVTAHTLCNLADVLVKEGEEDDAYKLWQKAFLIDEDTPKDILLYNMFQYDLEHNRNIEDACERLYEIFSIKDSLNNALKDRTIQELQQIYDEEVIKGEYEKKVSRWIFFTIALALVLLLIILYSRYKRNKDRLALTEQQMLINNYQNKLEQMKAHAQNTESEIEAYKKAISEYVEQVGKLQSQATNHKKDAEQTRQYSTLTIDDLNKRIDSFQMKINELECSHKDDIDIINELNTKITEIIRNGSPRLNHGKILYDAVLHEGTTVKWSLDDYKCFIEYYKAVDLSKFKNIEKRYRHLTPQNAFFLILYEMGMSDKDVCRIMGITQEAIRSTRFRIRKSNNI